MTKARDLASIPAGSGALDVNVDGATVATFDRATSEGTIVDLQKDGSSVGSIGTSTTSSNIYFTGASGEAGIELSGSAWLPMDNGSRSDGGIDLGASSVRHRDLYLSGGVYVGGTVAANYLDDYEEGTWTPIDNSGAGLTFTTALGTYVKIGNRVWINMFVDYPVTSSATAASISGLPFSVANTNANYVGSVGINGTGLSNFYPFARKLTTALFIRNDNNQDFANSTFSGNQFGFSACYTTND